MSGPLSPTAPPRLSGGGLIDRARPLSFTFDGREHTGFAGDTLASALLANGVTLVGRSFKYHRPRGILTAGSEEPNALVELRSGARREPNSRATMVELYDRLTAASQNRWPSLEHDLLSVNRLAAPLFGAGFYYKTFMWPAAFWEKLYEPMIRRAAGLGRAADAADPDQYEKATAHCDLLVIGAGPAGLMAALTAARAGARVILADEDFRLGGRLLAEACEVGGTGGIHWAAAAVTELASFPDVTLMPRTTVFGVYDGGTYGAVERVSDHLAEPPPHAPRQRLWRIVAHRAVLAAGAIERPIVFGGNDRPGVMMAGAVRAYANRFAAAAGRAVAVFANNDGAWSAARDLLRAGVRVEAVIDVRDSVDPALTAPLHAAGARVLLGSRVVETAGKRLKSIEVMTGSKRTTLAVDTLAMSGGWSPNVSLTCHMGNRPVWNEALVAFVPGAALPPGLRVAGAAAGHYGLAACLRDGAECAAAALGDLGFAVPTPALPQADDEPARVTAFWHVAESKGAAFVDQQNDVTAKDIAIAHREGFRAVEHLKRYTTLGMATDQGKTANVNGLAIMAALTGKGIPETGTTMFRPPYTPVAIGAFAGHHRGKDFRPTRLTPTHAWATERGAVFVETGPWLRAQYYPRPGERDWLETVNREVTAVRTGVGLCDVSTLGKIDIQGPDAGTLLDRLYINAWSTLGVGKARYGVMLREDGMVMDDGTTARLGPNHFVMTTTTANAVKVFQHLEHALQVLWPDLDAQIASVSDQWAQIAVAGPKSRDTLARIVDAPFDLSNDSFPFMAAGELTVLGGLRARLFRISFSGELAYELAVPAGQGDRLVRALMEAGADFGITPYGTETLGVLRIEKGHAAGNELNGQTTARDLGLGRMMSTKKDFIGRVMSDRPGLTDPARPVLVGFRPLDRAQQLRAGAHLIPVGAVAEAANDQGYLTSVAWSPTLGHSIGLGFLANGQSRLGERVRAVDLLRGADIEVEICNPVFVDPQGEKLRV
ncbi:sarcosine oxidase, subunit alpha (plasmid) [Azospirillum sp. B510]|uniref:sarcosine oxidase subunit alpha family protein n=1 Tax=Azospirillum sp. (strain B510) TaxID=137722 RepID=UPI0001C4BC43|nr:sarcosine oxidase subunit alpha family protein [Azospirillum sp. B510]BAI74488.1 sarcosine oxidase, subunit alpha [Azospirillum sp. B510]